MMMEEMTSAVKNLYMLYLPTRFNISNEDELTLALEDSVKQILLQVITGSMNLSYFPLNGCRSVESAQK